MAKIKYSNFGVVLNPDSIAEAMNISECFVGERSRPEKLSWHSLVTRSDQTLSESQPIAEMGSWGVSLDETTLLNAERVLRSKRKAYRRGMMPLSEWRDTPAFKQALERVESLFGKPMKDGRVLFPYQLELAAYIVCVKRILNSWEMGLGKTIGTLVGLASDPTNKLNLIVTMSRNMNDWVNELNLLGFEENQDFIILKNPSDLKKTEGIRFHLVSYEKWSADRITFRKKVHTECPHCHAGVGIFKPYRQYCTRCNKKADPVLLEDGSKPFAARWSETDLPKQCPACGDEWKKGVLTCNNCSYSLIEKRIPSLSHYYHKGYDAVAVDEAHYIKNIDTQRAKSIIKIKAKTRVLLTGTPAENEVTDLYWLLGWLTGFSSRYDDPIAAVGGKPRPFAGYGKVGVENFRAYYGGGAKRRVLDVDSIEARIGHHEKLWRILDTVMVRKKKTDDDVKDYIAVPEPKHIRYHLELLPAERELYDLLVQRFREWYENEIAKKEAAAKRFEKYRINTIEICMWMECAMFPDNLRRNA